MRCVFFGSWLDSTARLAPNNRKLPVEVEGQRHYWCNYYLWSLIPLAIVLLAVLFSELGDPCLFWQVKRGNTT